MAIINIEVPDKLRDAFKAVCTEQGQTMRGALLKLIRDTVAKATRKG